MGMIGTIWLLFVIFVFQRSGHFKLAGRVENKSMSLAPFDFLVKNEPTASRR